MAITTYQAIVVSTTDPDRYVATVRDFELTFNHPDELNWNKRGVQINEALLWALGACESIVAGAFHRQKHFPYYDLYLTLKGIKYDQPKRLGLDEIHLTPHFRTSASQSDCESFVEFMESRCPVFDNLSNTVPIKSSVEKVSVN